MHDDATSRSEYLVEDYWSRDSSEVLEALGVDPDRGISASDATRRRERFGHNRLRGARRRPAISILLDQFKSVVIVLLAAAGTLAIAFADHVEGLAIFAVIAINSTIGFLTEWRAVRSMEALSHLGVVDTVVMRDGKLKEIPAVELVPGDIVVFEGGEIVTADIRLTEAALLQADESTLTGESMPVSKSTEPLRPDTPMMARSNTVYKGTAITRGSGKGVVVGTGFKTELGRISQLVTEAEALQTPLEKRLDALANRLVKIVVILAVLLAIAGVIVGRDTMLAIEVAIALAVAAIPEGLPIVATIALARGMWRMARRNALIAKLSAVETLGATSVIMTDKTGTLTENRMLVTAVKFADADVAIESGEPGGPHRFVSDGKPADEPDLTRLDSLLVVGALCSNAAVRRSGDLEFEGLGDPTEVALLIAGEWRDLSRERLLTEYPEIAELSFDPDSKLMATFHEATDGILVAVKGAPEAVLPICTEMQGRDSVAAINEEDRSAWLDAAHELGTRGLRTLALARKTTADAGDDAYADLCLLGIVGMEDPPRSGVKNAINQCREAGISVIMVTGDHAATARSVALDLGIAHAEAGAGQFVDGVADAATFDPAASSGLDDVRVFSRVSPEQKLRLIEHSQQAGKIVAMTGDGVNDAPALKKADIGIAMGIRGTDVAKEASAMVLQDDDFGTIVEAVNQGRAIYANIRKFVVYLLSCNTSEILVVTIATLVGAPLPLLPLQILFLNLITDVFPALALGVGEGSRRLMKERPRPADEPVLTGAHWTRIAMHGMVIALTVLAAMAIAAFGFDFGADRAITVSFCTLALAQVWHVFNMRDDMRRPFNNEITRNLWVWIAVFVCLVLILSAVYVPLARDILRLTDPGRVGWLIILSMSFVPVAVAPFVRMTALGIFRSRRV